MKEEIKSLESKFNKHEGIYLHIRKSLIAAIGALLVFTYLTISIGHTFFIVLSIEMNWYGIGILVVFCILVMCTFGIPYMILDDNEDTFEVQKEDFEKVKEILDKENIQYDT